MEDVPDSPENEASCLCGNCPSKNDDGLRFYCVRGPSPAPVNRGFCACNWCPLWSGYALTKVFHCAIAEAGDEPAALDEYVID
ncbi:MAG: hypothetical protein A2133_02180 [Actinobacteria bacterium RBG_16_64_13]|nr:MAG: hypothetical protein A2133_02180 [Actinobacteria bacterium RBG_16_64_13]